VSHNISDGIKFRDETIQTVAIKILSQKTRGSFLHGKFKKLISGYLSQAKKATIDYRDSGYDQSSYGLASSLPVDRNEFKTIDEFLFYPTGETRPTFCSGSGMSAETWLDRVSDVWCEIVFKQYNAIPEYQSVVKSCVFFDRKGNKLTDMDLIIEELDQELLDYFLDSELLEAWRHDPLP
jgi:hypothetical protein